MLSDTGVSMRSATLFWTAAEAAGTPNPASPMTKIADVTRSRGREVQGMRNPVFRRVWANVRLQRKAQPSTLESRLEDVDGDSLYSAYKLRPLRLKKVAVAVG